MRLDSSRAPTMKLDTKETMQIASQPTIAMEAVDQPTAPSKPDPAQPAAAQPTAPQAIALQPAPGQTVPSQPAARQPTPPRVASPPPSSAAPASHEDDPEWQGAWSPTEVDPEDITGMTLHMRHRRRNIALGVVGAIALVAALLIAKNYIDAKYAVDPAAGPCDVVAEDAVAQDTVLADATSQDVAAMDVLPEAVALSDAVPVGADSGSDSPADTATPGAGLPDAHAREGETAGGTAATPGSSADAVAEPPAVDAGQTNEVRAPADVATAPVEEEKPADLELAKQKDVERRKRRAERQKKAREKKERDKNREKGAGGDDGDVSGSFDSLMAKGDKARKSGKYSGALKYFTKARSLKPSYAEPNYKMAECYRSLGKCSSAVDFYDKAISISGFRNAYIGIAKCYRQMGDKASARKYLEKGVEKYNDGIMRLMLERLK